MFAVHSAEVKLLQRWLSIDAVDVELNGARRMLWLHGSPAAWPREADEGRTGVAVISGAAMLGWTPSE
jgi:hypothetical protein